MQCRPCCSSYIERSAFKVTYLLTIEGFFEYFSTLNLKFKVFFPEDVFTLYVSTFLAKD